jgi:hypothetical protein
MEKREEEKKEKEKRKMKSMTHWRRNGKERKSPINNNETKPTSLL